MKFANNVETSEGLQQKSLMIASNEQLNEALYAWFIQQEYLVLQAPILYFKRKPSTLTVNYMHSWPHTQAEPHNHSKLQQGD